MKIAYFDCNFGAAGDMLNAALLGAGADQSTWRAELAKIKLNGQRFQLKVSDVMRCGLAAKKVDVLDENGIKWDDREQSHKHEHHDEHDHSHHHDHVHDHEHRHDHEHKHEHEHVHDHEHKHDHEHRRLPDILKIIDGSGIRPGARMLAGRIFTRLAEAESRVHGVRPDQVHFHEVGAVDAIVDIVGFSIAYDLLGIEKSFGSAVAIGGGSVKSQHGRYPVPGPATLYLLEAAGAPIADSAINFECLTPTGAAILCEVVQEWGRQPGMLGVSGIGYGAGTKDPAGWPYACRVILGEASGTESGAKPSQRFAAEPLAVVEANLDDFNPQALAFAMDRLFESGALDVTVAPVTMKKGRAGHLITVLCKPEHRVLMQEIILEQTSSIGVRWHVAERLIAKRQWREVELRSGAKVRIKVAMDNQGNIVNAQPEFDDCARYAEEHLVPVKDVLLEAMTQFRREGIASGKA